MIYFMRILKFFAFNKFSEKALSKSVKAQGDFIEYTPFFNITLHSRI